MFALKFEEYHMYIKKFILENIAITEVWQKINYGNYVLIGMVLSSSSKNQTVCLSSS